MGAKYYMVKEEAMPEVLLKVAKARQMIDYGTTDSVQAACAELGISKSSYYKYKDAVEIVADEHESRSVTISCVVKNQPGMLSQILEILFKEQMNVETIFQSTPVGGVAEISINAKYTVSGMPIGELLDTIRKVKGVASVKLLARDAS